MQRMLITALLCFAMAINLIAQASETISYQGYLTDEGKEISGTHDLTFRIFAEKGIEPVWAETHKGVEIVDGLFNVYLGSIEQLDIMFMRDYFLSVQLDDNEPFSRIPFSSVASSFYSKKSGVALSVEEGAVNSTVISNEAGVAHEKSDPLNSYRGIEQGTNAIDSISIEVPAGGYVYITSLLTAAISHNVEIEDEVYFQIMEIPDQMNFSQTGFGMVRVPANLPTATGVSGNYAYPVHLSRVIPVKSAGVYTFYLNGQVQGGWDESDSFINAQLTAIYFPTAYGGINTLLFNSPSTSAPVGER